MSQIKFTLVIYLVVIKDFELIRLLRSSICKVFIGDYMLTVVIPAYNEESCIINTLKNYDFEFNIEIQVIVVANGCVDNTANVVKEKFNRFQVVELFEGSKIAAINKGLSEARYDHILIQDADVLIDRSSILELLKFIESEEYLYASPIAKVTVKGGVLIKSYYKFLKKTPAFAKGMVNSGAYLLSKHAVKKLGKFPRVIADDGYVKGTLGPENLRNICGCYSFVKSPEDIWSLIKIKTRSKLGNIELAKHKQSPSRGENHFKALLRIAISQRVIFSFLVYCLVTGLTFCRAKYQVNKGKELAWERDESTRK